MTEYEMRQFIVSVVKQTLAPILMGKQISNTDALYGTAQVIGKANPVDVRNVLPYGLASRAMPQTTAVLAPVNGDPSHINILGHADDARPTVEDGEVMLYSSTGQMVYVSNGKIQVGSKASSEPLVLGNVLQKFLDQFLTSYLAHTHEGNLGFPTGVPINASDVSQLQSSPIEDKKILSQVAFTEAGGS